MSLRDHVRRLSAKYRSKGGIIAGEIYRQYRPVVAGTEVTYVLISTRGWRIQSGNLGNPDPLIPGVLYGFGGYADMTNVNVGDVFVPVKPELSTWTYIQYPNMQDMNFFRCTRQGSFFNGEDPYLENVYYEWMAADTPMAELAGVLAGQIDKSTRKLVVWGHGPLQPQNFQVKGLNFRETDGSKTNNLRYMVKLTKYIHPLLICTVEEE